MLRGWIEYAEAHKSAYDSEIEDDHVLGDENPCVAQGQQWGHSHVRR